MLTYLTFIHIFYSLSVPPSISGSNNMVAVVVNHLVRLECEARGIPAPSLTWLKDGSPVSGFANGIQVGTLWHSFSEIYYVIIQYRKYKQVKLLKRSGEQGFTNVIQSRTHTHKYRRHTIGISKQSTESSVYPRVPLYDRQCFILTICFRYCLRPHPRSLPPL